MLKRNTFILILLLLSIGNGCINKEKKTRTGKNEKIQVTDFRGLTINVEKPVERIVCLIESALSGIYMLGAENKIVGISTNVYDDNVRNQYACLDDRIKNKTIKAPGNWDFVNIESVVALKPDLVIMWASQKESILAIESKGIQVYAVMLKSTNDIYKEIGDLGRLTGKEKRADSLIQYTKDEVCKIIDNTKKIIKEKKKVYFMWSQGPLETSGVNSTVNELITMAGATNICTSPDEHLVVNFEKIIDWNPDIIVMWYNANKDPGDIMQLSAWRKIKAIKEKSVFELPSVFFCDLWTLKFQYAIKMLTAWCYPEEFKDHNLEKEKQQMLTKLYGNKGEKIK